MGSGDLDTERWLPEQPKDSGAVRDPYQRDRARVLHSAGFRRLASKTQVHTAGDGSDAFLRTRLTHSLEVAQIAREMGQRLGCHPDLVDTAGLAHDLGHPPFGHNGEFALDQVAQPCGGFEGNAQTLRVLTRLEAKVPGAGLNLTRASLDAVCKYPWFRREGERKFGAYADDQPVFEWFRAVAPPAATAATGPSAVALAAGGRPAGPSPVEPPPVDPADPPRVDPAVVPARRCLEAQVMDWADDVAYSVHDVEDGFHSGYISLGPLLADPDEQAALCADVAGTYSAESASDLAAVLSDLLADPVVATLSDYDGSHAAQATLKRFTSVLTGRFVAAAVAATRQRAGERALARYDADLVVPRQVRAQCALLKGIALRYVMRRRGVEPWYSEQRQILIELVAALCEQAPEALDPVFAPMWKAAPDDPGRLRVVVDQVASLTDPAAVAWHQRLCRPARRPGHTVG